MPMPDALYLWSEAPDIDSACLRHLTMVLRMLEVEPESVSMERGGELVEHTQCLTTDTFFTWFTWPGINQSRSLNMAKHLSDLQSDILSKVQKHIGAKSTHLSTTLAAALEKSQSLAES